MRKFFAGVIAALVVLAGGGAAAHAEPTSEPVATSVLLVGPISSSTYGDEVIFTATVTGGSPTGSVVFVEGAAVHATAPVSDGTATFRTSRLGAGDHSITARYLGDEAHAPSPPSSAWNLHVAKKPFAGRFEWMPVSMQLGGTPLTLSGHDGTISGTGKITVSDTFNVFDTYEAEAQGAWETYPSPRRAGSTTFVLTYAGDANHEAGSVSSNTITQVRPAGTSITLDVSKNAVPVGGAVEATATVASNWSGQPLSGEVEFFDQGVSMGVSRLGAGVAKLTVPTGSLGTHVITAKYHGLDSYFAPSALSAAQTVDVALMDTITWLEAPATSRYGDEVALTAIFEPTSATGAVTFTQNGAPLGHASLAGGEAVFTTAALAAGNHTVVASYAGDARHYNSTSRPATVNVAKAATTAAVQLSSTATEIGEAVTATATVTATNSAGAALEVPGKVEFFNNGVSLGAQQLDAGTATIALPTSEAGTHKIMARYLGHDNFEQSGPAERSLDVRKHATTTTLAAPATSTYGDEVALTATVAPKAATGSITFEANGVTLGTGALKNGVAELTTAALGAGTSKVTATYSGDDSHTVSASEEQSITVSQAKPAPQKPGPQKPSPKPGLAATGATPPPLGAAAALLLLAAAATLAARRRATSTSR